MALPPPTHSTITQQQHQSEGRERKIRSKEIRGSSSNAGTPSGRNMNVDRIWRDPGVDRADLHVRGAARGERSRGADVRRAAWAKMNKARVRSLWRRLVGPQGPTHSGLQGLRRSSAVGLLIERERSASLGAFFLFLLASAPPLLASAPRLSSPARACCVSRLPAPLRRASSSSSSSSPSLSSPPPPNRTCFSRGGCVIFLLAFCVISSRIDFSFRSSLLGARAIPLQLVNASWYVGAHSPRVMDERCRRAQGVSRA